MAQRRQPQKWTQEEDEKLMMSHRTLGNNWKDYISIFPNRDRRNLNQRYKKLYIRELLRKCTLLEWQNQQLMTYISTCLPPQAPAEAPTPLVSDASRSQEPIATIHEPENDDLFYNQEVFENFSNDPIFDGWRAAE
jgi:hypothetical protein